MTGQWTHDLALDMEQTHEAEEPRKIEWLYFPVPPRLGRH
jgi:hypothetical protein